MRIVFGISALLSIAACTGSPQVVEERVTYDHGVVTECGEGPGLSPCRDANGLTYEQELDPNYIDTRTNEELLQSSEEIRNESPEELEKTIEAMEDF